MTEALSAQLVFAATHTVTITLARVGRDFVRSPIGATHTALWTMW